MDKSRRKYLVKVLSGDHIVGQGNIIARNPTQAMMSGKSKIHPSVQITEVWVNGVQTFPYSGVMTGDRIKETTNFWLRLAVPVARRLRAAIPERHRSDFVSKVLDNALAKIETVPTGTAATREPAPVIRGKPQELEMS